MDLEQIIDTPTMSLTENGPAVVVRQMTMGNAVVIAALSLEASANRFTFDHPEVGLLMILQAQASAAEALET